MSSTAESLGTGAAPPDAERRIDGFVVSAAVIGGGLLAALIALETAPYLVALFGVGIILGIALYHGAFGFTGGWRRFVVEKRSAGMRAQIALLALASILFIPLLGNVSPDSAMGGAIAPVGVSLVVGSFLFGIGMQLGGGCGSGTLFTVGAGNIRMVLTLIFFIVGSVIGTIHLPWWLELPGVDPISLITHLGVANALALQLLVCAGLAWWFARIERRHHGTVERRVFAGPDRGLASNLVKGQWPMVWAVVVLALGNLAVLLLSGHPWGITFAFGLWGAKVLQGVGVDMSQFEFWTWDYPALALADSVLVNVTSVTNFGLLVGAMLAAGLAGRFNKASAGGIPSRSLLAAVVGGLLMGYGARLGFGCNIGALFSGIASASLHGWVWFAAAWIGSLIGIRARPWFSLSNQ
ncbi:putative membrane protein YedE/YeeE [Natronocella acetinitrilica]|uniref:Membrane protein YedE/YeeE n=1 Tax=Natronocella acetinitrilica TaxID=414046 RepID=A0AAE3G645_9GAMM|nr:YeeE/YedE family protein [Natronocella acetinitrilica]MCP1676516.1 putative membrane protein YedE/YeeE [Natronocella acetinitrilica]